MSYSLKRTKREYTPLPVNDRRFDYVLTEAEARQQYSPINSAGNMVMKLASDVNDMKINISQLVQKVSLLSSGSSSSSGSVSQTPFNGGTVTSPLIINIASATDKLVRGLKVLDSNHAIPGASGSTNERGLIVAARALEANYGPACVGGDVLISAVGADFTIQRHSNTNNGIRMTPTSVLVGAGGTAVNKPTASLLFSDQTVAVTGDLVLSTSQIFYPTPEGKQPIPLGYLNNLTSSVQNQLDSYFNRISELELKCRGFQYAMTSDVLGNDTSTLLPIPQTGFNSFENWVLAPGIFTSQLITSYLHTPSSNGYASVLLENLTGLTSSVQAQLNTLTSSTKTLNTTVSTLQTDTVANLRTELNELKAQVKALPASSSEAQGGVGTVIAVAANSTFIEANSVKYLHYNTQTLLFGRYLFCNGTLLRIVDFPELYRAIGKAYTTDDMISFGYFYIPDLREAFIKGAGTFEERSPGQGSYIRPFSSVQPGSTFAWQNQSIQEHTHPVYKRTTVGPVLNRLSLDSLGPAVTTAHIYKNTTTANLTQPNCICLNYYIQAFSVRQLAPPT